MHPKWMDVLWGKTGLSSFGCCCSWISKISVHKRLWLLAQLKWSSSRTWPAHLSIWQAFVQEHSEVSFFPFTVLCGRDTTVGSQLISLLTVEKGESLGSDVKRPDISQSTKAFSRCIRPSPLPVTPTFNLNCLEVLLQLIKHLSLQ